MTISDKIIYDKSYIPVSNEKKMLQNKNISINNYDRYTTNNTVEIKIKAPENATGYRIREKNTTWTEHNFDNYNNEITFNYTFNNVKENKTIIVSFKINDKWQKVNDSLVETINYIEEFNTEEIINKKIEYEYSDIWKDQLTKYDGKDITYDSIGNPLTIGDNITLTWINGRSLQTYKDTSKNLSISYKYNEEGIRISKTINGKETKYFLEDTDIIYEIPEEANVSLYYIYDNGEISGLKYYGIDHSESTYYYTKNIQGDIIGLLDEELNKVVTYEYGSWGKVTSIKDDNGDEITDEMHIGHINPFRYRGYYYDKETGLYYLNSRYYNPEWGRFINADKLLDTGLGLLSYNIYLYCNNNPIMNLDLTGAWAVGIHLKITKKANLGSIITSILKKYKLNNLKNRTIAMAQLLVGSVIPDIKHEKYPARTGWHGIRQTRTEGNAILAGQYKKADELLKSGKVAKAFLELGAALHSLQDNTSHFMMAGVGTKDHSLKNDLLMWDYSSNTGKFKLTIPTVGGNRRAALAAKMSTEYLKGFLKNNSCPYYTSSYFFKIFK